MWRGRVTAAGSTQALAQAVADCAEIAAALHKVEIKLGEPRTLDHELASLAAQMAPIEEFSLALALQLQKAINVVGACAALTRPWPLVFSHGDYTYTQLIFAEHSCGLVDFDTVVPGGACARPGAVPGLCAAGGPQGTARQGARGHDGAATTALAELPARATDAAIEPPLDPAAEVCAWFLNTYIQAAGYRGVDVEQLCVRVAMYEIVSLVRIAQHSWLKLKGSRLELVTDLLEERVKCLSQSLQILHLQHGRQHTQRRPALVRPASTGAQYRHGSPQP